MFSQTITLVEDNFASLISLTVSPFSSVQSTGRKLEEASSVESLSLTTYRLLLLIQSRRSFCLPLLVSKIMKIHSVRDRRNLFFSKEVSSPEINLLLNISLYFAFSTD